MRIRKRQVPLPLSSLLPVPLSDLYSNQSPTATARYFCGQDRDGGVLASLLQLSQPPAPVSDDQQRDVMRNEQEKALDDDDVKSSTDASGSRTKNVNLAGESDSSAQVVEKNENVVTLRKRRGFMSFEEQEEDEEEEEEASGSKGKKKGKKSGALEEGSRCSRVNGRGWRCCQQTLYGYSLCEHHLGKGRVRSMNKSAGGRGGRENKKAVVVEVKNKRVKIGMVKARSISSLLGQSSTSSDTADVDLVATESEISAPADQFAASDK